ncbi:hypothetical protein [Saprospira grandis]|uniref:hypothetical protein n=1 Tax=Saprospira grandis TaxID=1008 RepID=UPI0022DD2AB9|nr:hypothetical protein [Saprospira grandis]WBM73494.1 hypothetical protein OP864_10895 [Saprospira grandis]
MRVKLAFFLFLFSFFLLSCQSSTKKRDLSKVKLLPLPALALDQDSSIQMRGFNYQNGRLSMIVQNLLLGQAVDSLRKRGQKYIPLGLHLHLVLNDSLHAAQNDRNFQIDIPDGPQLFKAFLSAPNGQVIRAPQAFVCRDIETLKQSIRKSIPNRQAQIAYASPLGQFSPQESQNVIVDFYRYNCEIGPKNYQVLLELDQKRSWWIQNWQAHSLQNLPPGPHQIQLSLYNAQKEKVYGPIAEDILILEEE